MSHCVYCDEPLPREGLSDPEPGRRTAFDPWRGRLWRVCPECLRWNPVPLEDRWEALEACERAVEDRGRVLLSTEHLALVDVGGGELVRVGEADRPEFAGWRYGDRVPRRLPRPRGIFQRFLGGLPDPDPGSYDPYALRAGALLDRDPWLASPFLQRSWALTTAFTSVPLAPECPSCGRPMLINPWHFQEVRFLRSAGRPRLLAVCALCRDQVTLRPEQARPALRLGLALVTGRVSARKVAEPAGREVGEVGGRRGYVELLAREEAALGELGLRSRVALALVLDEEAEAEALEAEWREAEEIAAIMDGELTRVPGFEEFRERVLEGG